MIDFALTAVASILFVVDPFGALPAYLVLTEKQDPATRRRTARKAALFATVVLGGFATAGDMIFRLLGLTWPALKIAGGLILLLVAIDMIRAQRLTQQGPGEIGEGEQKEDVAITPIAVPMLAGPAALSTVVVLMSRAESWSQVAIIYLAILFTGTVTYATLRLAEPLYRKLGRTGLQVLTRVFGLILMTIAVQFLLDGLQAAKLLVP